MSQSSVLIKNVTINICHADPSRTVYLPRLQANLQKEKRDFQTISPLLRGRGKNENDRPYLYRVRIDLPPQDLLPVINDLVFVARHTTNPHLRGWYTIWDDPEPTAGDLPTYLLYLHKEA